MMSALSRVGGIGLLKVICIQPVRANFPGDHPISLQFFYFFFFVVFGFATCDMHRHGIRVNAAPTQYFFQVQFRVRYAGAVRVCSSR